MRRRSIQAAGLVILSMALLAVPSSASAQNFSVLGQPDLASTSLAHPLRGPERTLQLHNADGFDQHGPSGIAVDSTGSPLRHRLRRRSCSELAECAASLTACQPADRLIQGGGLDGPEAVAVDDTGTVYVASTLEPHGADLLAPRSLAMRYTLSDDSRYRAHPGQTRISSTSHVASRSTATRTPDSSLSQTTSTSAISIFNAPFTNARGRTTTTRSAAGLDGSFRQPEGRRLCRAATSTWPTSTRTACSASPDRSTTRRRPTTPPRSSQASPTRSISQSAPTASSTSPIRRIVRIASYFNAGTSSDRLGTRHELQRQHRPRAARRRRWCRQACSSPTTSSTGS